MTAEGFRYRLIDTDGSELTIINDSRAKIDEGETVELDDGTLAEVVEVYDDEHGQEGEVQATLVVDLAGT